MDSRNTNGHRCEHWQTVKGGVFCTERRWLRECWIDVMYNDTGPKQDTKASMSLLSNCCMYKVFLTVLSFILFFLWCFAIHCLFSSLFVYLTNDQWMFIFFSVLSLRSLFLPRGEISCQIRYMASLGPLDRVWPPWAREWHPALWVVRFLHRSYRSTSFRCYSERTFDTNDQMITQKRPLSFLAMQISTLLHFYQPGGRND